MYLNLVSWLCYQEIDTRNLELTCAYCEQGGCVGELEGGILAYAEWTGNQQNISHFGHRFESSSQALDRLGAAESL